MSRAISEFPSLRVVDENQASLEEGQLNASAAETLTELMMGSLACQSLYVAAKLGVADLLKDGPKAVEVIAKAAEVDANSLYRVLRALASFGVFEEEADRVFRLNAVAAPLCSNAVGSLRNSAIFMGEDWHWKVWGKTLYSVRTGKPAWREVHGQDVFPYLASNQKAARIFDDAMTSYSTVAAAAVIEAYDFSSIETLVDVAGGHGRLLSEILKSQPEMRGVLFDQPHVLAGAKDKLETVGVAKRCELVGGDFFKSVPANADGYILKHIIHDWDDEEATRILHNIRSVMRDDARVLLIESVIAEGNQRDFGKLLDIEMLVSPGGRERTAVEYGQLLAGAGLRLTRIISTKSPYSVIEAVAP